jgi:hypothetical protein
VGDVQGCPVRGRVAWQLVPRKGILGMGSGNFLGSKAKGDSADWLDGLVALEELEAGGRHSQLVLDLVDQLDDDSDRLGSVDRLGTGQARRGTYE